MRGTRAARTLTRFNPPVSMSNTALHKSMAIVAVHISTAGSAFSTGRSTFRTSTLRAASIPQTLTCSVMVMRHHTSATQHHRLHALPAPYHLQVRAHSHRRLLVQSFVSHRRLLVQSFVRLTTVLWVESSALEMSCSRIMFGFSV
jgi:hypothetical protein